MRNMFYGYEVQSFGTTVAWTLNKKEADEAFAKSHSITVQYKHNGEVKAVLRVK